MVCFERHPDLKKPILIFLYILIIQSTGISLSENSMPAFHAHSQKDHSFWLTKGSSGKMKFPKGIIYFENVETWIRDATVLSGFVVNFHLFKYL
jgi:hypothetical protein